MSDWNSRLRRHGLAAVGIMIGVTLMAAPAYADVTAQADAPAHQQVAQVTTENVDIAEVKVTRSEMLARARGWLTANNGKPVPYGMDKFWKGGYRQDCSGYVSMAAKLSKPGATTVTLFNTYTVPIPVSDMRPGDLFIDKDDRPGADFRHVVIFEKWADAARTQYWAYEQRGTYGTTYRKLSYGLKADDYKPRRLKSITG